MNQVTPGMKHDIAKRYLNETTSYRYLSNEIGVDDSVIRYWVKLYQYHGDEAFIPPYTNYPAEFKMKVIQLIENKNYSIREASAIFRVPHFSMVRRWRKKWKEGGVKALESAGKGRSEMSNRKNQNQSEQPSQNDMKKMQEELEYLRAENAYLKKLRGLSSRKRPTDNQIKAQVVYELRNDFSVKLLVQVAGLKRNTYYYQALKMNQQDPDGDLKESISSIYHEHAGRYGYRRIHMELLNRGYKLNHKKVARILKELGLKSRVRRQKYVSYKGQVGKIADNTLNRDFTAQAPNQKWVTDITEFKLFGKKLYLSPVQDLFNGEIIAYNLDFRPTYKLVETMLEDAFDRLTDDDELLMHSDQGVHYQMPQYRKTLAEKGIVQSMSRKGNCHDNAVIENFFSIFKTEFLYNQTFENLEDFKQKMDQYIHYFNHKRIKMKLNGKSPVAYRELHQAAA
ncbi:MULTISPECIES: IS3 family transposase [Pontibacillus]|uniref:IS3 family transposase n=1 Tax=Pontibacillus chungwhensis TaxID=265426 RepID=A0ABY8UWZ5_9BACI|nr:MULTISPECIES: IS3 family transposase [Pontibacillus]MCD5323999.1 IS3 family transposase [Pontibacillus sp. HN14]WIF97938.1 IS3 family transposase [Pontibacillus chungwhensis]